jgi:hypothetical protein
MAYNTALPEAATDVEGARSFWKTALIFTLIGLALYLALLVIAEMRVRATGERNPFFQIATVVPGESDVVILGASHAMPLGFEGIGTLLEEGSGRDVMVLAIEGGGVVPNALLLDALLRKSKPRTIVYALDTFAFLSRQWNEDRLNDSDLYARAPHDSAIIGAMIAEPAVWRNLPGYLLGFDKVNRILDPGVDRSEAELTKFERTYRANDRIDDQRVAYLFPDAPPELMQSYVNRLEEMATEAQQVGSEFAILLMPAPPRYKSRLPQSHEAVMEQVRQVVEGRGLCVIDHTSLLQGDENYYDTDHLNRTGAEAYVSGALADVLRATDKAGSQTTCAEHP